MEKTKEDLIRENSSLNYDLSEAEDLLEQAYNLLGDIHGESYDIYEEISDFLNRERD